MNYKRLESFVTAMSARDRNGMEAGLTESPSLEGITLKEPYTGKHQVLSVIELLLEESKVSFVDEIMTSDRGRAAWLSKIISGPTEADVVMVFDLDAEGLIQKIGIFGRPLVSLAELQPAIASESGLPKLTLIAEDREW